MIRRYCGSCVAHVLFIYLINYESVSLDQKQIELNREQKTPSCGKAEAKKSGLNRGAVPILGNDYPPG